MKTIPEWLRQWIYGALIGEIYPAIRAIAVRFTHDRSLTFRYYLDRNPHDEDAESLSMVMAEVLANTSSNDVIFEVHEECLYTDKLLRDLDVLDGLVYARREYETEEIQGEKDAPSDGGKLHREGSSRREFHHRPEHGIK